VHEGTHNRFRFWTQKASLLESKLKALATNNYQEIAHERNNTN
jgi:hypothetical protein